MTFLVGTLRAKTKCIENLWIIQMAVSGDNVVFLRRVESGFNAEATQSVAGNNIVEVANSREYMQTETINEFALSLRAETLAALEEAADEFNRQIRQKS